VVLQPPSRPATLCIADQYRFQENICEILISAVTETSDGFRARLYQVVFDEQHQSRSSTKRRAWIELTLQEFIEEGLCVRFGSSLTLDARSARLAGVRCSFDSSRHRGRAALTLGANNGR
jgi:hypothetical protein